MLIRFSVKNFTSFKEQQFFSMAAGKQTRHKDHVVSVNEKKILKGGFFFGANAAGKSNLIRAVSFARQIILRGTKSVDFNNQHFRIDPLYLNRPGVFQFDIFASGHFYSYGFSVCYLTKTVASEWLYLCDNGEERLFERHFEDEKQKIETDIRFSEEKQKQRFDIYAEDIPNNKLFLCDIAERNLSEIAEFKAFRDVWEWFERLVILFPTTHYTSRNKLLENDNLAETLKLFDTGIERIEGREVTIDKVLQFLPEEIRADTIKSVDGAFADNQAANKKKIAVTLDINGNRFELWKKNDEIFAKQVMMDHGNPLDLFEYASESDGTQRLFDLIPLYQKGQQGHVILIDELDRSFHTKLTIEYIKSFFRMTEGCQTQLIATTHDANVMDLDLLRQDEIWFIERQKDHSSRIYSLNRYQVRFDKKAAKDYLLGRYGAIPCFKQMEEKHAGCEECGEGEP